MSVKALGRQPSPEVCQPTEAVTTTETVGTLIGRNPLRVNSLNPNRHDAVVGARLWVRRERLHRRQLLVAKREVELDSALIDSFRSSVSRLEFAADALEKKGDQESAALLRRRANALRVRIKGLRSERGAKWRALTELECQHEARQRALLDEITVGGLS
jgi:hypothetical protein